MGREKIRDLTTVEIVALNATAGALQQAAEAHKQAKAQQNAVLQAMALDPGKVYDMREGAIYAVTEDESDEATSDAPTPIRGPTSEE